MHRCLAIVLTTSFMVSKSTANATVSSLLQFLDLSWGAHISALATAHIQRNAHKSLVNSWSSRHSKVRVYKHLRPHWTDSPDLTPLLLIISGLFGFGLSDIMMHRSLDHVGSIQCLASSWVRCHLHPSRVFHGTRVRQWTSWQLWILLCLLVCIKVGDGATLHPASPWLVGWLSCAYQLCCFATWNPCESIGIR